MPRVKVRAHAPGERSISVVKGSQTVAENWSHSVSGGGSEPPPGSALTGNESVQITVNRTSGYDPAGFFFKATASGFHLPNSAHPDIKEAHAHDLRYRWSFDDPDRIYDRMEDDDLPWDRVYENGSGDRIILHGDLRDDDGNAALLDGSGNPVVPVGYSLIGYSANRAYGPAVGKVFAPPAFPDGPITKTVIVEVLSRAMVLAGDPPITQSIEVTVLPRASAFTDAQTCYIDPAEVWPDAPAGSPKVADWTAALLAMRDLPRIRFRFRRGQTHDVFHPAPGSYASGGFRKESQYDYMMADAFGDGIDPELTGTTTFSLRAGSSPSSWVAYDGLFRKGGYDPSQPWTAASSEYSSTTGMSLDTAPFSTTWDCRIQGFNINVQTGKDAANIIMGNVYIGPWRNYGFFAGTGISHSAWVGFSVKQHMDTVVDNQGSQAHNTIYAVHGPWRCSFIGGPIHIGLAQGDSMNSWTGLYQPSFRAGGNGSRDEPFLSAPNFDRVFSVHGILVGNGVFKGTLYGTREVYDKIVMALGNTAGNGAVMSFGKPGVSARNIIAIVGDQPSQNKAYGSVINMSPPEPDETIDPSATTSCVNIYNTTIVDMRSQETFAAHSQNWSLLPPPEDIFFTQLAFENSIVYTPFRDPSTENYDISAEPIDMSTLIVLRYPGLRKETQPNQSPIKTSAPPLDLDYAYDHELPIFRPKPGSAAYQSAVADPATGDLISVDDFFGRPRPLLASKGAVEPIV